MDYIILKSFIPEIFFSVAILCQLIFNARLVNNLKYNFPLIDKEVLSQTFFILLSVFFLFLNLKIEASFSNFIFLNDEGARIIKILFVLTCLSALLCIMRSFTLQNLNFFEFFNVFLLSIFALFLLASSYDLMSAYLTIEMQALCFYILASFRRNSAFSTEAGLKYFISGSFISGIFLLGCSLIYGGLGTLRFDQIALLLSIPFSENSIFIKSYIILGILLITISLLFKVTAAPFHFWAPDVYEGSPLSTTIIFSIVPKLMLFTFFLRWILSISLFSIYLKSLFIFVGILSIFIGSFFAIKQKRLKRLLIYSSIAQVGFLVASLSTETIFGYSVFYFFLFIYIITSILIWSNITLFYSFQKEFTTFNNKNINSLFLTDLSNFFFKNPLWSLSFILIFFSIAGIPPLSGFFAKVFIIFSLVESHDIFESFFFVIISCLSVFYYLRILKTSFFESKDSFSNNNQIQVIFNTNLFDLECVILTLFLFLLLFIFFFPTILLLVGQYVILTFF